MVSAILVAAGNSTRTGGVKKQFLKIRGVPVVVRSAAKLQHTPEVGGDPRCDKGGGHRTCETTAGGCGA